MVESEACAVYPAEVQRAGDGVKSGTIQTHLVEQYLRCRVCTEVKEIPRKLLRDQDALLMMVEDVIHDHRECAANVENPKLAILQRGFRKRLEHEEKRDRERAAKADRPRRCSGR